MTNTAYILLGSNLGDRENYLSSAIDQIESHAKIVSCSCSSVYSSPAVQMKSGTPSFLNQVLRIETELTSIALLAELERIEQSFGRTDKGQQLSRTIDLDILLYGSEIMYTERLTIPHPELLNRAFALIPLIEIEPTLTHPQTSKRLDDYLTPDDYELVKPKEENAPVSF